MQQPFIAIQKLAEGAARESPESAYPLMQEAYRELRWQITGRIHRVLSDPHAVDEVAQETWRRVWRGIRGYKGNTVGELRAWIKRICINETRRWIGRRPAEGRTLDPFEADNDQESLAQRLADPNPGPERESEETEAYRALEECIETLPSESRTLVSLLYLEERPFNQRQAADRLDCSLGKLNGLKQKALAMLRECLERKGVE